MSFYKRPPKNIEDLANVTGTPDAGEALVWNGAAWAPAAAGVSEEYVDGAIASLVNSAPETLDTLNELSAALGNDENFATTVATSIGTVANQSMRVVAHAADSTVARPAGASAVYWIGSVAPDNAVNSDLWYDTTGDA